ncbi:glycosyltransferase involved in cell wall biosynthesis [Variovorax boronicumulans]|uniref:Glycosyltransferase involved in cell wall biosynthesis n=1 Tax=Variovorax boronicumulans TaxID=436515 RepID=A0AAW8E4K4_9BURK|nr:glycosyltransferase family 4 protein [Variovorax boronicumulans]MDP9881374.1 glycosyltransferase involved in cell wall biosynthesis [Variovorax boronicumulans]MDP9926661.1 glycosyltransferase involved in cell wall biosynthesis [Variovorax boronicumulans]
MKQVWILNHYAQEPTGAGGTRHFHLAEYLATHGWQATLIAASVEFTSGRQRLAPEERRRYERINGVPFLWIRTPEYTGNGGGRMLNMLSYTWQALRTKTLKGLPSPDVIIGSSVHPFAAVAAALLARRFKVPFVFEVRDLWPQTLIDMGRLRESSFTTWALRKLEKWLYLRAARIVVLLPGAWEYIVPLGIPKERIVWIPNGVDLSLFPSSGLPTQKFLGSFTLMYFGAHGQANGLENLLEAMTLLKDHQQSVSIRLRMIGDGPLKPFLIEKAKSLGLDNIIFEPPVSKGEIPNLASQADAFVIPVPDLPKLYRYGISPNKLFDYLAAARPIIIATGSANNPVADAEAGFTVPAGEPLALSEAILKMALSSKEERARMGRAGREYVEKNHGFLQLSGRLAVMLKEIS